MNTESPSLLPRTFLVHQRFSRPRVDDVEAAVRGELERLFGRDAISPGARIAVTVGSRGISAIDRITRTAVDFLRSRGAQPFIVPAMGSHGGATPGGQKALIAHYGVTEETMGCPVRAEMETRSLGLTEQGVDVRVAAVALDSEGILLVNRVKPHTDYKGPIESGLTKICAIGLGKLDGASSYHSRIFDLGLGPAIRSAAEKIVASGKVLGGVAILENAYHETARIVGVPAANLFEEEELLLQEAYGLMGALPFSELDVLLCDRLGKNISGAGLDTNIIGRSVYGYTAGQPWMEGMPSIYRIFVRSLSPESNGNGVGMGLVDFTTTRFMDSVDLEVTRLNAFTSRAPLGARPPIVLPSDREAIESALRTAPRRSGGPRLAYVRDTLSLEDVYLSETFLDPARKRQDLEIASEPRPLEFDDGGWLRSPF